jgi:hypothetical protein
MSPNTFTPENERETAYKLIHEQESEVNTRPFEFRTYRHPKIPSFIKTMSLKEQDSPLLVAQATAVENDKILLNINLASDARLAFQYDAANQRQLYHPSEEARLLFEVEWEYGLKAGEILDTAWFSLFVQYHKIYFPGHVHDKMMLLAQHLRGIWDNNRKIQNVGLDKKRRNLRIIEDLGVSCMITHDLVMYELDGYVFYRDDPEGYFRHQEGHVTSGLAARVDFSKSEKRDPMVKYKSRLQRLEAYWLQVENAMKPASGGLPGTGDN